MSRAVAHHYVPVWYQRRFLGPDESTYFYLDLHPDVVTSAGGKKYTRRDLLPWSPKRCFYRDDLYSVSLGEAFSDEIERKFFGRIDETGKSAVEFFSKYSCYDDNLHEHYQNLVRYMDAQRCRTPRGLEFLGRLSKVKNRNAVLVLLNKIFQLHATMWMEGIWEVVHARSSPTKFIVTDGPVTFFNSKCFPGSAQCKFPDDVPLHWLGTRTLFPLGPEACLLITHVGFTRDPWANQKRSRINARSYQQTMTSLLDIQFGRELTEEEVLRVNYILKRRATRDVASSNKEWLFPEKNLMPIHWSKLDDDWFLFPHLWKVRFSSGIVMGFKGGGGFAMDEYGRRPRQVGYQDKKTRDREWTSHLRAREEWAVKRAGFSISHVDKHNHDEVDDELMADFLAKRRRLQA